MAAFQAAFYKGRGGFLSGAITRWWDSGPYSHCELVFSDGTWATSYSHKGVVLWRRDDFKPDDWDFIELPANLEEPARSWFEIHKGKSYDYVGLVRFVLDFLDPSRDKWFCSRACADALSIEDGWRWGPNGLSAIIKSALKFKV